MSEEQSSSGDPRSGGRRQGDRRRRDRRRTDRRAPPPLWRRPAALVAYGVLGTLALVVAVSMLGTGGSAAEGESPEQIIDGAEARGQLPPPSPAAGPAEPAFSSSDYERLIVEGSDARGRLIQVELFCGSVQTVSTRSVDDPDPLIRALEDGDGRVSGAECRWGPRGDDRREDFFLLLGGEHAEIFADAPIVDDGFVRRRHLVVEVEWIGRSEELSLRTVGVLRGLASR